MTSCPPRASHRIASPLRRRPTTTTTSPTACTKRARTPASRRCLGRLTDAGFRLATASAKRTSTAQAIIAAHGLTPYFTVIGGTDATRVTKAATLAGVLADLDADPATTIMVGDRRHDIAGAHACRVAAVGARWGYSVGDELAEAGADWLVDDVAALGRLLGA